MDSALKDMAVVMKQLDRSEEAIEAIKSFRDRCSKHAQESLDNVLIDLYKVRSYMNEDKVFSESQLCRASDLHFVYFKTVLVGLLKMYYFFYYQ